jgi:hypothetical protein
MRCSPLARITRSGSGRPTVYKVGGDVLEGQARRQVGQRRPGGAGLSEQAADGVDDLLSSAVADRRCEVRAGDAVARLLYRVFEGPRGRAM